MILPGEKLGLLGGGQLGRMFTIAARTMGYYVIVLDPDKHSPAGSLANEHLCAPYDENESLEYLANTCSGVTTEFENVPASSLEHIQKRIPVRPGPDVIRIARDRILEKQTIRNLGLPTTNFHVINSDADLNQAMGHIQPPAILKTATMGYDGKGQVTINNSEDLVPAYNKIGCKPCVLEQLVDLKCEISVVLARSECGHIETYPVGENQHRNGILDITIVPARVQKHLTAQACRMARMLAEELNYVGVLAVEFFIDENDLLLINEIAPRPHNSGHFTLDACLTNQFQQQVRTLCGFPPGDTSLSKPAVMVNILGDAWQNNSPRWSDLLQKPGIFLHLYDKKTPTKGRKMGHFTCVGNDLDSVLEQAKSINKNVFHVQ